MRHHDRAATALQGFDHAEIEAMDLMDPASIDAFAERFLGTGRLLHVLVNTAGIMATPLVCDARGYESQFATNHLGHFQLVARLWPALGVIDERGKPILDPARGLKTVQQGAATSVWCATSPQLNGMGGVYCENCDIAPLVPKAADAKGSDDGIREFRQLGSMALGVMPYAVDPEAADRLWKLSERLTGSAIQ